ncbi:DUF6029 family protein [Paenimyroides ceti]
MRKIVLSGFALMCLNSVYSQINVGFESNAQYYVDDKKIKIDEVEAEDRLRSNSYLKLDYHKNKWEVGVQLESYLPKSILSYSNRLDGFDVGTVYAKYNDYESGFNVTLGHFYEQFGSGLILRSWEDRALGINNALFGANVQFRLFDGLNITALTGKQRLGMGFDLSKSLIMGTNLEYDLTTLFNTGASEFKIGGSYVGRMEEKNDFNKDLNLLTNAYSARLDFAKGNYYFGGEYIYKDPDALVESENILDDYIQKGNALLVNLGYSANGFAANVNLRRMENMNFYSERQLNGNLYNTGVINYIPALTKQYDYALQNIHVYQAQAQYDYFQYQKLGEIGGQFDVFYEVKKGTALGGEYGTSLILNGSYWAGLKSQPNVQDNGLDSEFLEFGRKYYKDLGLEVRKKWSGKWQSIFMYLNQYYNSPYLNGKFQEVTSHILTGETTYFIGETNSIRLELQHLWADSDSKNWAGGTIEYVPSPKFSFFVHDIYNYGNSDESKQIHYYNVGGSFTKGATRIAASYGRQRGGLLCVGGVCRMVPEAAGFTLNITTNF